MQWRRDLWLLVLAVGAGLFVAGERTLAATENPSLITPLILVGAATAPAAFTALSHGRELRCTLPGTVLAGVAALAGLFGAAVAGLLSYQTVDSLGLLPTLAVAVLEEAVALLMPLAVLWALPTRRAADGLLIGAAAGAGFAATEAASYLVTALVDGGGAIGTTDHELLGRGLLGPAAHLAWTGIAATALWLAAQEKWNARALRRFVLAAAGVVLLHTLWELADSVPARLCLTGVALALLGWVVRHIAPARRRAASPGNRPTTTGTTVRKTASPAGRLATAISRAAHHTGPSRPRRVASAQAPQAPPASPVQTQAGTEATPEPPRPPATDAGPEDA